MRVGAFEIREPSPDLRNTCAIAILRPWIDVGKVGTLALRRLERHLGATELGRLARPGTFFDFTRVRPRTRVVEGRRVLDIPNSVVRWARDKGADRDYLFLHLREPHNMGEEYTDSIVALLRRFNVMEYCRIGGMYDQVPHSRRLLVTGNLTDDHSERTKALLSSRGGTYQGPTSIVNLVTQSLEQMGVSSESLMVHIPQYVQLAEDHMGAYRLLEVLCAMYDFPSSLADPARGQQQYRYITQLVEQNRGTGKDVVQRLETDYDGAETADQADGSSDLAPEVEKFLREMGGRLEEGPDSEE